MNQLPPAPALTSAAELADAVRRLRHASVLVIGDAMLDRHIQGELLRARTESPMPVLRESRELAMAGGAGNLVRNLTALGAAVAFIAVVGDDQAGSDLTGLIGGQPGVEPWLLVESGRTTAVKTRYIAADQILFSAVREQTEPIGERLAEQVMRFARDSMAATSVTVLSDHGNGVLSGDLPVRLIAAARQAGRPVLVDPAGPDYERYAGADLLCATRGELAKAVCMPVETAAELVTAAEAMRARYGLGAVLVTDPHDRVTLIRPCGVKHSPAARLEPTDRAVAGDAVLATLACALATTRDFGTAARLAGAAVGVLAGKTGAATVSEAELLEFLGTEPCALVGT